MGTHMGSDGSLTSGEPQTVPACGEEPSGYRKPPMLKVALVYHVIRISTFNGRISDIVTQGIRVTEVVNLEMLDEGLKSYCTDDGGDALGLWSHAGTRPQSARYELNRLVVTQVIIDP